MADEHSFFVTFERKKDFLKVLDTLVSVDLFHQPTNDEEREDYATYTQIKTTLSEYQEQSYLLDPYLEQLIVPVIDCLKNHAKECALHPDRKPAAVPVQLVSEVVYLFTKFRGYKSIVRFFPHEVADMSVVLDYMRLEGGIIDSANSWALRYVMLLWLSLISMIPFNLTQLDEPESIGETADILEGLGKKYLDKAGLDREGASMLLSRLYMRTDTASRFHGFVHWATTVFRTPNAVLVVIGIQRTMADVAKSGPLHLIQAELTTIMTFLTAMDGADALKRNSLVRKYRAKILSRLALRLLPHQPSVGRHRKGRTLEGKTVDSRQSGLQEVDVPEEVEQILEQLFDSVQDADTIVRWSTSKGIARIAESLPHDFAIQILETLLGLFDIHSIAAAQSYDLPAIAEATWHGACLACAEMARRNLVPESHMGTLVGWLSKALYFDIRKGAHSIGSNVRDAAAYVLWALARTQDVRALEPHAHTLAKHLVSVAIYDREIHIRRAASAAFQEHVGRTNLFPHGIDVLGKTDFYSVSVRKQSFTVAAPQVARHEEYRFSLLHHVLDVVLRHWDTPMRELGAQSLRSLCLIDLDKMTAEALPKIVPLIESYDPIDVHGGLLALAELGVAHQESIGDAVRSEETLQNLLAYLSRAPEELITAPRNHLVTAAACRLITTTLTKPVAEAKHAGKVSIWLKIINVGMKHRLPVVQEAAAEAVGVYSTLADVSTFVIRTIEELKKGPPIQVQSLAQVLGSVDYNKNASIFPKAVATLLDGLKPVAKPTIESRKAWLRSILSICSSMIPRSMELLTVETLDSFVAALVNGLEDYTIDERGDVGSWARVASLQGLTSICESIIGGASSIEKADAYLPPSRFLIIVASILKQGVERLDNVRQEAGNSVVRLLRCSNSSDRWNLPEFKLLNELFMEDVERVEWVDAAWLFPRTVRLLDLPAFRQAILSGSINSIGSKTDTTQKEMSKALVAYVKKLPLTGTEHGYSLYTLMDDLLGRVLLNVSLNKVVLPIFQTFNVLLEEECLDRLDQDDEGLERLRTLVKLATKNVGKLKSVQRIHEAMKIFVRLLVIPTVRDASIQLISEFLAHPFPKVRFETAEYFYLQVETADFGLEDTSEIETVLLETRWSTLDIDDAKAAANNVASLFQQ